MRDPRTSGSSTPSEDPLINRVLDTLDQFSPERIQQVWDAPSAVDICSEEELVSLDTAAGDRRVAEAYARHYLMPLFDPPSDLPPPVDPGVAATLPGEMCRQHRIAPLADDGQILEVAIAAPEALLLGDQIKRLTGRQMQAMFAPASVVERLLDLFYEEEEFSDAANGEDAPRSASEDVLGSCAALEETLPLDAAALDPGACDASADSLPLVPIDGDTSQREGWAVERIEERSAEHRSQAAAYFQRLVEQTLQVGADGVHLEPWAERGRVRLRIGGVLQETEPPPARLLAAVVERVKRLAKIEPSRSDLPGHGTILVRSGDQRFRLKVSSCPTVDGERLVIGVGSEIDLRSSLNELGFDLEQRRLWAAAVGQPGGLILVAGPSGSGKTTTLYAALGGCNGGDRSIVTAEQRVHGQLPGVQQVAPGERFGHLQQVLPPLLHQDPDVLMVDEIDDAGTAEVCLRAASTGPLVMAGLHAGDALSGLQRACQLAGGPLLVGRSLRLVVAQRLLRRLCEACRVPWEVDRAACRRYDLTAGMVVYRAGRCAACCHTGYRGRVAVLETLPVTAHVAERISAGESLHAIEQMLHRGGYQGLAHRALDKAVLGETSLEEVAPLWIGR